MRLMGYTPAHGDVDAESDDDAPAGSDEEDGADGVVDRAYLKMRAAKLTARHNAKAAQQAAQVAGAR